jgi:hypothetical protein
MNLPSISLTPMLHKKKSLHGVPAAVEKRLRENHYFKICS